MVKLLATVVSFGALLLVLQSVTSQINNYEVEFEEDTFESIFHHQDDIVKTDYHFKSPVIFVPGIGGSQLDAKLNKTTRVHYICDLVTDWYDIWLNVHLLVPWGIDCLIDNMRLIYNSTTRTTQNSPGVQIRPHEFGSVDSVEYLDNAKLARTDYFHSIVNGLTKYRSYVSNINMFGAPYDFRKAPNELSAFYDNFTDLIETSFVKNGFRRVTIICHSLGCLNTINLLNNKTEDWKDVYIKRLVAVAAPWGGSFKAISSMLFGDNLGIPLLPRQKIQALQSSFPSLMYLFPVSPVFSPQRVLVQTPQLNYTLKNLDQLMESLNMSDQLNMWQDTRKYWDNMSAPNVELWCIYSTGIPTPSKITFLDNFKKPDNSYLPHRRVSYREDMADGDGTVNLESSEFCKSFALKQKKPVKLTLFNNVDHIDILRSVTTADYIVKNIITCDDSDNTECDLPKQ